MGNCIACGGEHIGSVSEELRCLRTAVRSLTAQVAAKERVIRGAERQVAAVSFEERPVYAPTGGK